MDFNAADLGDLQIVVLRALWAIEEGTVYDVQAAIHRRPAPAYTTVLTALRSLEKRGLVAHYRPGSDRQYRYRPLVGEAETERGVLTDVLQRLFCGSPERLIRRLLEAAPMKEGEIAAICRLLAQYADDAPALDSAAEPASEATAWMDASVPPLSPEGGKAALDDVRARIARSLRGGAPGDTR